MYTDKIMQEFRNPQNVGELSSPDGVGKVGNPTCGDVMQVHIKVENGIIKKILFKTYGCVAAVAASSMMTQLVKNKSIKEAKNLTKQAIIDALGGDMPPAKVHCSLLAIDSLKKAIDDYNSKH